ncbi:MAG: helix-turn-helix domain-containing protein [Sedimentisphaerales bacterium]|nr:helix-turn-helix domain-containing protein [Sedimentisphaerales bacterium]
MAKGKNVLTTGDVAKICNVAPRTVSKWFDNGQLKGYRIPGSKDRRIPVNELVRFMKVHDMPTTALLVGNLRVLVVDGRSDSASSLARSLADKAGYEVETVTTDFQTGAVVQKFMPHVLVVNLLAEEIDAAGICASIRADEDLATIRIVALSDHLSESESGALLRKGFDACICNSGDVDGLVRKIEELTAIIY